MSCAFPYIDYFAQTSQLEKSLKKSKHSIEFMLPTASPRKEEEEASRYRSSRLQGATVGCSSA